MYQTSLVSVKEPLESSVPRFAASQWSKFKDTSRVPSYSQVDAIQLPENVVQAAIATLRECQLQSFHENMDIRRANVVELSKAKANAQTIANAGPGGLGVSMSYLPNAVESRRRIETPATKPIKNNPRLQGPDTAPPTTQKQASRPARILPSAFNSPSKSTHQRQFSKSANFSQKSSLQQSQPTSSLPSNNQPFSPLDQNILRPRNPKHSLEDPGSPGRNRRRKTNHNRTDLEPAIGAGELYSNF